MSKNVEPHEEPSHPGGVGRQILVGLAQALVCTGFLLLLMTVLTPARSESIYLSDTYSLALCLLSTSVLVIATRSYVRNRNNHLLGWAVFFAVVNILVMPAVVVSWARVPASYAMPHLLLAFWTSVVALILMLGVKFRLLESHKIPSAIMGGGVGITGFVLLMTQIGVVANGYPARVPMHLRNGSSELPITSELKIAVRFDNGSLKNVYLDNGMLTVHQPVYYHQVDYTVYPAPEGSPYSGHAEISQCNSYTDAIQSIFSFGLVHPTESEVAFAKMD